ncbi:MAG TPA: DUF2254 family protein [Pyrinomonadaceae bacterium]
MRISERLIRTTDAVRRAFVEFLTVPTLLIAAFVALALASYMVDRSAAAWLKPAREFLQSHIFSSPRATSDLLIAVASGIIAVTSITITLLLIIAQQTASTMTAQVFDQFLRRKTNQLYLGFFIGLALYALITLATVNDPFNPIFGGTITFVLTFIALYLLALLLYTTVNQMRPVEIIEAIHEHILLARKRELVAVRRTRRVSRFEGSISKQVKSEAHGYVTQIDLEKIGACVGDEAEVILLVSFGSFVAFGDALAVVKANNAAGADLIGKTVFEAIDLDRQRDIDSDAGFGIEQLETIGWTSISSSKSNPAPGIIVIHSLRDILARWSAEQRNGGDKELPIVYVDHTADKLLSAFETLAVVSSESMQHQNYIEVLAVFAATFDRLPTEWQARAEDLILRILSVMGDHALTRELDQALSSLADKLESAGSSATAVAVRGAGEQLSLSVGVLNSRATRVSANG